METNSSWIQISEESLGNLGVTYFYVLFNRINLKQIGSLNYNTIYS